MKQFLNFNILYLFYIKFSGVQYDQVKNYELHNPRFPIEKRSNSGRRRMAKVVLKMQSFADAGAVGKQ